MSGINSSHHIVEIVHGPFSPKRLSIRLNDQWRICFLWREDGVHGVEIVDYH